MSSYGPESFRHRRSSSAPYDTTAASIAPSAPVHSTDPFTSSQRANPQINVARSRPSVPSVNYTFSFRRSEHPSRWLKPPSYEEAVSNGRLAVPSNSYSFSPSRPRSCSSLVTPLRPTEPWTPAPNQPSRHRTHSSPVSPIISPLRSAEATGTYRPYRPDHIVSAVEDDRSPTHDLPTPFASPEFWWSGTSNQEVTDAERIHQEQMEDLSLMSPYGSPLFYWSGSSVRRIEQEEQEEWLEPVERVERVVQVEQAEQEEQEASMLDKVKKVWGSMGLHKLNVARPAPSSVGSIPTRRSWDVTRRTAWREEPELPRREWDERRKTYVLVW